MQICAACGYACKTNRNKSSSSMLGLAVVLHFCFWYFPHPRSMTYAANDNTQSNLSKQTATLHPIQSLSVVLVQNKRSNRIFPRRDHDHQAYSSRPQLCIEICLNLHVGLKTLYWLHTFYDSGPFSVLFGCCLFLCVCGLLGCCLFCVFVYKDPLP